MSAYRRGMRLNAASRTLLQYAKVLESFPFTPNNWLQVPRDSPGAAVPTETAASSDWVALLGMLKTLLKFSRPTDVSTFNLAIVFVPPAFPGLNN